jgi:hypothetical protein
MPRRALLLPDAHYAVIPSNAKHRPAEGTAIEYGGLMPQGRSFQRLVVRFNPDGKLHSVTNDVYTPA